MAKNWMEEAKENKKKKNAENVGIIKPNSSSLTSSYTQCSKLWTKADTALSKANTLNSSKPKVFTGGGHISACADNIEKGRDGITSIKSQVDQAVRDFMAAEQANWDLVNNLTVEDILRDFKDMFGRPLTYEEAQRILEDLKNQNGDPPTKEDFFVGPRYREEDNTTIGQYNPGFGDIVASSLLSITTAAGLGAGEAVMNTGAGIVTFFGKGTGKVLELFGRDDLAETVYGNTGSTVSGLHSIFENPYDGINSKTRAYIDLNAYSWFKEDAYTTQAINSTAEFMTSMYVGNAFGGKYGAAALRFLDTLGGSTASRQVEGYEFDSASNYGLIVGGVEAAKTIVRGNLLSQAETPIQKGGRLVANTTLTTINPVVAALADSITSERSFNESFERQGGYQSVMQSAQQGAVNAVAMEVMGSKTGAKVTNSAQNELNEFKTFMIKDLPGLFREIWDTK